MPMAAYVRFLEEDIEDMEDMEADRLSRKPWLHGNNVASPPGDFKRSRTWLTLTSIRRC